MTTPREACEALNRAQEAGTFSGTPKDIARQAVGLVGRRLAEKIRIGWVLPPPGSRSDVAGEPLFVVLAPYSKTRSLWDLAR